MRRYKIQVNEEIVYRSDDVVMMLKKKKMMMMMMSFRWIHLIPRNQHQLPIYWSRVRRAKIFLPISRERQRCPKILKIALLKQVSGTNCIASIHDEDEDDDDNYDEVIDDEDDDEDEVSGTNCIASIRTSNYL